MPRRQVPYTPKPIRAYITFAEPIQQSYVPRHGTMSSKVMSLLRRPQGATMAEIARATNWTPNMFHSFKWAKRKSGVRIACVKNRQRRYVYKLQKGEASA